MSTGLIQDSRGNTIIHILEDQEIIAGRGDASQDSFLNINNKYVSRRHCIIKNHGDFMISDLESKNGTFVNGIRIKQKEDIILQNGDSIDIGGCEFIFRVIQNDEKIKNSGGLSYNIKNTLGGRKLQFDLKKRGCIEYQMRMIEENPQLSIGETIYVSNIEKDHILCDIGGYASLESLDAGKIKNISGIEMMENLLKLIKLGEEHLLSRDNYVISPDTVFINSVRDLRLIYLPCKREDLGGFNNLYYGMKSICVFFKNNAADEEKEKYEKLEDLFNDNKYDTKDYLKIIYHFKDIRLTDSVKKEIKPKRWFRQIKKQHIITLMSFISFMCIFWMDFMSVTHLIAVGLILTGMNILMYGISDRSKELYTRQ